MKKKGKIHNFIETLKKTPSKHTVSVPKKLLPALQAELETNYIAKFSFFTFGETAHVSRVGKIIDRSEKIQPEKAPFKTYTVRLSEMYNQGVRETLCMLLEKNKISPQMASVIEKKLLKK